MADQLLQSKKQRYDQIAEWCKSTLMAASVADPQTVLLACHDVFKSDNLDKIKRKAAMCYVLGGDYDKAGLVIDKCPPDEAATQYLNFLVGLNQGKSADQPLMMASHELSRP